jgi:hypothetical protein
MIRGGQYPIFTVLRRPIAASAHGWAPSVQRLLQHRILNQAAPGTCLRAQGWSKISLDWESAEQRAEKVQVNDDATFLGTKFQMMQRDIHLSLSICIICVSNTSTSVIRGLFTNQHLIAQDRARLLTESTSQSILPCLSLRTHCRPSSGKFP